MKGKHIILVLGIIATLLIGSVLTAPYSASEKIDVRANYTTHGVIRINRNNDFTSANGVVSGTGTKDNPYVISGWDIDAQGAGDAIYIGNTTAYFVVENCYLYDAAQHTDPYFYGSGITLYNVVNGDVKNNNITGNNAAVYLYSSSGNTITGNNISNNIDNGIYLHSSSGNTIAKNNISNSIYDGVYLYSSSRNIISDNNITDNYGNGVSLFYSSNNNKIRNNTILNNRDSGIIVYLNSLNNVITGNRLVKNSIRLDGDFGGDKETFTTQIITPNNTVNGKPVYYYKNMNMDNTTSPLDVGEVILGGVSWFIIKNLNLSNTSMGIEVGYSSHILIVKNHMMNITTSAYLYFSYNITISDNAMHSDKDGDHIYVWHSSNNTISGNSIIGGGENGIKLGASSNNTISGNYISGIYNTGIKFFWHSSNNTVTGNNISNNHNYGLYIDSYSSHDTIYNNSFYYSHDSNNTYNSSHIQAYDDGTNNYWNSTTGIGNYWYDWANNNDSNDNNYDGIVDGPYKINGSAGAKDYYPLKNPSLSNVLSHPMNLTAKAGDGYVNLTWEPPVYGKDTVTQYNIYRNGVLIKIKTVPENQLYYNDTNVQNGQTYTYYVTAVKSIGESDKSNEAQATPQGTVPEFPVEWIAIISVVLLMGVLRKRE